MVLDLLGFVYYNKIRDRVREEEGGKDREVDREVRAEERGGNNNE
jgi:hypothetical protein